MTGPGVHGQAPWKTKVIGTTQELGALIGPGREESLQDRTRTERKISTTEAFTAHTLILHWLAIKVEVRVCTFLGMRCLQWMFVHISISITFFYYSERKKKSGIYEFLVELFWCPA